MSLLKTIADSAKIAKEEPFNFSKHSSIGVGGEAEIAFYPENEKQFIDIITRLQECGLGYIIVGNMTNVLPPDAGTKKAVICTKRMSQMQIENKIFVSAGVMSGSFLKVCCDARKSGAEFLVGIPCTIGGALYMNAGVNGRCIAEIVESVLVYREGEILTLSQKDCQYSYKSSVFMKNEDIILGVTLRLTDSNEENIRAAQKFYIQRRAHLPKGKSMGCVFKNPLETSISAGEWIERAGLKGERIGGAYVSEMHANFIINEKNATAKDIRSLIMRIKERVYTQYKVLLQEEIRYLE